MFLQGKLKATTAKKSKAAATSSVSSNEVLSPRMIALEAAKAQREKNRV